jgi:hypothetical protein
MRAMRGGRAIFAFDCPLSSPTRISMKHNNEPELDALIQANRRAINRLRSLTEDLTAVVEHEKRLVKDIQPMLDAQHSQSAGQKEGPEPARRAPDPGSEGLRDG